MISSNNINENDICFSEDMWNPNNKKCDEKFNIESGRYCEVQIFLAKPLTLCSFDLEIVIVDQFYDGPGYCQILP